MIRCARTYADDFEVLGQAPAAVMLAAGESRRAVKLFNCRFQLVYQYTLVACHNAGMLRQCVITGFLSVLPSFATPVDIFLTV